MHFRTLPKSNQLSFFWALVLTVLITAVLVGISFFTFINSGAYETVKQISAAENVLQGNLEDIDTTSPIQASDLGEYADKLPQRVKAFDDAEDFGTLSL
jgi:hypothetical protein